MKFVVMKLYPCISVYYLYDINITKFYKADFALKKGCPG